jgi:hypothetical protein
MGLRSSTTPPPVIVVLSSCKHAPYRRSPDLHTMVHTYEKHEEGRWGIRRQGSYTGREKEERGKRIRGDGGTLSAMPPGRPRFSHGRVAPAHRSGATSAGSAPPRGFMAGRELSPAQRTPRGGVADWERSAAPPLLATAGPPRPDLHLCVVPWPAGSSGPQGSLRGAVTGQERWPAPPPLSAQGPLGRIHTSLVHGDKARG